ncbi:hypothetical protein PQX77_000401 [Marasmius sp. AFHP31]|nr:hypothetical protein PQX77_000401 [Marasmius sp. AFHP31]
MSRSHNPNFPADLNIHPSSSLFNTHRQDESLLETYNHAAQEKAIKGFGIAGRIWEAAYAIRAYLDPPPGRVYDPPFPTTVRLDKLQLTMIELGSGAGIVGSTLAPALAEEDLFVLTDLAEVCPLLESNVRSTASDVQMLHVRPLAWGNAEDANAIARELLCGRTLTHILCSDLVYFPELLAPLLRSLIQLSSVSFSGGIDNPVNIIISYKIRSLAKETPFWSAFGLWFTYEPLLERQRSSDDGKETPIPWRRFGADVEDSIFIFIARRRPESFDWTVPEDDHDLLSGMGARGSLQPKGDDQFESLLFMLLQDEDGQESDTDRDGDKPVTETV